MHAVLFDIDGTLIDSTIADDALYKRAITDVLGPVVIRDPISLYKHISDSGIVAEIHADNSVETGADSSEAITSRFVTLLSAYLEKNGPFPEIDGARRYVRSLVESENHAVAFATGGWREPARLKLETSGFGSLQVPIATSSDAQSREDIMKLALIELGDAFESITYFGDGQWDRDATRALGWQFRAVGAKLGGIRSFAGLALPGQGACES